MNLKRLTGQKNAKLRFVAYCKLIRSPEDTTRISRSLFESVRESISSQIKALRLSRGFTQVEVAKAMGTFQSVVSGWENPKKEISIGTLVWIANFYDVGLIIRFVSWKEFLLWVLPTGPVMVPASFQDELEKLEDWAAK